MTKPVLKVDWASREAAVHAVKAWHYTRKMPASKLVCVGAWEDDRYIGAVIFGSGAGRSTVGTRYGLAYSGQVAELVRVALRDHQTPVSRILAIALRFLRKANPDLKLVISFADTAQGHHGGIYQAGGWVYAGLSEGAVEVHAKGEVLHPITVRARGWTRTEAWLQKYVDPAARVVPGSAKHRYLMPLDEETRKRVLEFSQPYPKRVKQATDGDQPASGGAAPTHALQTTSEENQNGDGRTNAEAKRRVGSEGRLGHPRVRNLRRDPLALQPKDAQG